MAKIRNVVWLEFDDFAKVHIVGKELGIASNTVIANVIESLSKEDIKKIVKNSLYKELRLC